LRQGDLLSCIDNHVALRHWSSIVKGRPSRRPFCWVAREPTPFINRSKNKAGGTCDIAEHHPSPVVVGTGNANM
jgi:hypothetical protein